jgi:chorismate mutase/prephenate dehydrogenase
MKECDGSRGDSPARLLEQHRRDIEALDRRILHLVCERLELARSIGALKRQAGVPLRNFAVEAQVHRRMEGACADLGLEPGIGSDLAHYLIDKAVAEQATHLDAVYSGDRLHALVVGGRGGMGSWMASFLAGQGHRVSVLDPAPGHGPFPEVPDLETGVRDSDLVVVAVPMHATAAVLEDLAGLEPNAVVAEMCSLKEHLRPTLDRLSAAGLRMVSFHPMFGPDVRMLCGRTVVFCTESDPDGLALVRGLFESTSAELIELGIAEHDRRMAVVLGLTHLSNLVYARALDLSGVAAAELDRVAGVTFRHQIETTREVASENPELYFEIQALNPVTAETGGWLVQAVEEWMAAVDGGDGAAFTGLMESSRAFLDAGRDERP